MKKPNRPIILFLLLYSRMTLNFIRCQFPQMAVFLLLSLGILFVFFKTYGDSFKAVEETVNGSFLLVLSLTLIMVSFVFPAAASDNQYLKRTMDRRGFYLLSCFKHFLISTVCLGFLVIFPLALDLLSFNLALLCLPILFLLSPLSLLFSSGSGGKSRGVDYNSTLLQARTSFSPSVYASFCLGTIYFVRRNRKNLIAGAIYLLLSYLFVGIFLINLQQKSQPSLFIIPFFLLVLFSFDKNTDIYRDLKKHISPDLKIAFLSDLLFWLSVFLVQWVTSVVVLSLFGFKVFPLFFSILLFFPVILSYGIMLKFKFLHSRILRAFSAGMSIVLPVMAPIFVFLFWLEIKND